MADDDAPQLRLNREEQHRIWAMRLALTDITWHQPGREQSWVHQAARQTVIDEINAPGGDWMVIVGELNGLLDSALTEMFSTPDPDRGCRVVDLAAISGWLADELDGELYQIEHDL